MSKVGILVAGMGTVGASSVKNIKDNQGTYLREKGVDITIENVFTRNPEAKVAELARMQESGEEISEELRYAVEYYKSQGFKYVNLDTILDNDKVDTVVETIGGVNGIASEVVERAICAGKNVVTANKDLIASCYSYFKSLAFQHGVELRYEAAVCGEIPIIQTIADIRKKAEETGISIGGFRMIANGTSNFIFHLMETEEKSFEEALKIAQRMGYAESDPTNDVGGIDAGYKGVIVFNDAFDQEANIGDFRGEIEGIDKVRESDFNRALSDKHKYKSIVNVDKNGVRVSNEVLSPSDPLFDVDGVENAVSITMEDRTVLDTMRGAGAGGAATAKSIVSDILSIHSK